MFNAFRLKIEPKIFKIALEHLDWLLLCKLNYLSLIETPKANNVFVVGFKWVFKNNIDKEGNVVCNKRKTCC